MTVTKYYTDNNGFIVFAEEVEDELSDYVVLQAIGGKAASGVSTDATVEARIVKMDGTVEVVSVDKIVTSGATYVTGTVGAGETDIFASAPTLLTAVTNLQDNMFFTYKIDTDGNYELTYVHGTASDGKALAQSNADSQSISNGAVKVGGNNVPVNDNTVFIVAKKTDGKTFTVYTGKNAVPTMSAVSCAYVTKAGTATYVYVDAYSSKAIAGDSVFFLSGSASTFNTVKKDDGSSYSYGLVKALVNGEISDVKVDASGSPLALVGGANVAVGTLVTPTYNDDGVLTSSTACNEDMTVAYGYEFSGTTLKTNAGNPQSYKCAENAVVIYKDIDGNYTKGTMADYAEDANDTIYVVVKEYDSADLAAGKCTVDFVYIVETGDLTLQTLTYNDGSDHDLDATKAVQTVTATTAGAYTVTATATNAAETITYATAAEPTFAVADHNDVSGIAEGETKYVYVKVTNTITGDYTIYTVNFKVPADLTLAAASYLTSTGTITLSNETKTGTTVTADATKSTTDTITVVPNDPTNTTVTYCDTIDGTYGVANNNVTMGATGTKTLYAKVTNDNDGTYVIYTITLTAV